MQEVREPTDANCQSPSTEPRRGRSFVHAPFCTKRLTHSISMSSLSATSGGRLEVYRPRKEVVVRATSHERKGFKRSSVSQVRVRVSQLATHQPTNNY